MKFKTLHIPLPHYVALHATTSSPVPQRGRAMYGFLLQRIQFVATALLIASFLLIALIALGCDQLDSLSPPLDSSVTNATTESSDPPQAPLIPPGEYAVQRVVDGDTLLLVNGYRVRLLGVDTPETVKRDTPVQPWGREACEYTRQFCDSGRVWLEFDREPTDSYGRLLAYVYNVDRTRLLNEELIQNGLGQFLSRFPYSESKKSLFRSALSEAKRKRCGLWSVPQSPTHSLTPSRSLREEVPQ